MKNEKPTGYEDFEVIGNIHSDSHLLSKD